MSTAPAPQLPSGEALPFSEINGALARRPESAAAPDDRALMATIVVVGPDSRLPEAADALQVIGEHTGVRPILISIGTNTRPAPTLVGRGVVIPGLVPEYVNNAVAALRLSSLPTVVWWRGGDCAILDDLTRLADRIVLDSLEPHEGWRRAVPLFDRAAFSDLRWTRLTRWRTLMAQFFEIPEVRAAAPSFNRLRVRTADEIAGALFAGWLTSALGRRGSVAVEIQPAGGDQLIEEISFGDGDQELTLRLAGGGRCVAAAAAVAGHKGSLRTVSLGSDSLHSLMAEELRIRARDRVFETALQACLEHAR